jgi:hypothetical protein
MYDYPLGGKGHFAIDRETMEVGLRSANNVHEVARRIARKAASCTRTTTRSSWRAPRRAVARKPGA